MRQQVPRGIGPAGRLLWRAVADVYELEQHEAQLLHQAARVADRVQQLDKIVDHDGVTLPDGRTHPCLIESRLQRITLARLLVALRLPDRQEQRPQRRSGFRGHYGLREVGGG